MEKIRFNEIKDGKQKYRKLYHVMLFNYDDSDYALYVRNRLLDAQVLAKEKMQCPQVRAVQINEVVKLEKAVAEYTREDK